MKSIVLAALLLAQVPIPLPKAELPQVEPTPENLQRWPKSCQRLHAEVRRCELGYKSCDQHRVNVWRHRCEKDEPHT